MASDASPKAMAPRVLPASSFRQTLDTKVLLLTTRVPCFAVWEGLLRAILRTYAGRFELDFVSAFAPAGWLLPRNCPNDGDSPESGNRHGSEHSAAKRMRSRPRAETNVSSTGLSDRLDQAIGADSTHSSSPRLSDASRRHAQPAKVITRVPLEFDRTVTSRPADDANAPALAKYSVASIESAVESERRRRARRWRDRLAELKADWI